MNLKFKNTIHVICHDYKQHSYTQNKFSISGMNVWIVSYEKWLCTWNYLDKGINFMFQQTTHMKHPLENLKMDIS